jgi:choline-sulfatase
MVEALGGKPLPQADGRSFWSLLTGQSHEWHDTVFSEYCTDAVPAWTGGRAVQHRMVRRGPWKLHVYAGAPPLLFNLEEDPKELNDLSLAPEHSLILEELMSLVLKDWDPERIRQRMLERRERKDILAMWARNTRPESTHQWSLEPEMNRLDGT